ncbi:tRNA 2-selenouridine(34) synthase MnmH [Variovorax sp. PCZ-1]|uniref:tRNA 2-selenouridine(34) synthase MnmH n=1 Tax=Variovorax sp. PCZ-1 TaxID=2835533 RepID=UPI001BCFDE79|nr:tRNA 2-selenouridine(34) synthase MnmH [Variovorax sp. PCZ-1]MBS7806976.1 tRNA 2-selenouridine(34) synthase MnmH [Variovorax sp. PCZ-1]
MALKKITAQDALSALSQFSAIIDARSESEYALDRLPGALNWPTLNDAERHEIGTFYVQTSAFEAKKRGAALAAKNIAAHIEREVISLPKGWKPLVYCWRGGKRSGSLALILSEIGFEVTLIEGGYKAFRAAIVEDIAKLATQFNYRVICGPTGSGKTRLLQGLEREGAQVLDLEALAEHRSSVLGLIPGTEQPSQKQFDMRIWHALKQLDASRTVWAESESKKVGNVSIPDALMQALRASPCARVELPVDERVKLLLEDYDFFVKDPAYFCKRLDVLRDLRGHAVIDAWQQQIRSGSPSMLAQVVKELLELHYDPGYLSSTKRNYQQFDASYLIALSAVNTPATDGFYSKIRLECEGI